MFIKRLSDYSSEDLFNTAFVFLAALIFSGFFFLDKSFHRVVMYVFLLGGVSYYFKFKPDLRYLFHGYRKYLVFTGAAYLAYGFFSVFWSTEIDASGIFKTVKIPIFIALFVLTFSQAVRLNYRFLDIVLFAFVGAALCIGVYLFVIELTVPVIKWGMSYYDDPIRLQGIGLSKNSIIFAQLMGVACLILTFHQWDMPKIESFLNIPVRIALIGFFIFLIVASGSRGPFLALVLSLCMIKFLMLRRTLLPALILVAIGILVGLIFLEEIIEILRLDRPSYRLEIWLQAWGYIQQAPIFGHGLVSEFNYSIKASPYYTSNNAHNIFIGSAVKGGLFGFLAYCAFVSSLFLNAYCVARKCDYFFLLSLILFGLLCMQTAGHTLYVNLNREWLFCWIPAAMLMAKRFDRGLTT